MYILLYANTKFKSHVLSLCSDTLKKKFQAFEPQHIQVQNIY